jgi:hypothetical protein
LPDESADTTGWGWRGMPANRLQGMEAPGVTWSVAWPGEDARAELIDGDGDVLVQLPPERASPVLHERQWWNALIGNPGGYLPDGHPTEAIHLDLPHHEILPFGPGWMRGWAFLYFVLLVAGSLAVKFLWRIH